MRRNKPFVVAGNWQQFKEWCWENGLHTNDAEYVSEPHRVRGLQLHRDQIRYVGNWMDKSNAMEIDRALHLACAFHDETNLPWSETERGKQYLVEMAEKEMAQIEGQRRFSAESELLKHMRMFSNEELASMNKLMSGVAGRSVLMTLLGRSQNPVDPSFFDTPKVAPAEVVNPSKDRRGPAAPYAWLNENPALTEQDAEHLFSVSNAVGARFKEVVGKDAARFKAQVMGEPGTAEEDLAAALRPMTDPKIAAAVREVRDAARPWYIQSPSKDAAEGLEEMGRSTINGINAAMQESARNADCNKDAAAMDARHDELADILMEEMQKPITNTDPNGGCFRGPKADS